MAMGALLHSACAQSGLKCSFCGMAMNPSSHEGWSDGGGVRLTDTLQLVVTMYILQVVCVWVGGWVGGVWVVGMDLYFPLPFM